MRIKDSIIKLAGVVTAFSIGVTGNIVPTMGSTSVLANTRTKAVTGSAINTKANTESNDEYWFYTIDDVKFWDKGFKKCLKPYILPGTKIHPTGKIGKKNHENYYEVKLETGEVGYIAEFGLVDSYISSFILKKTSGGYFKHYTCRITKGWSDNLKDIAYNCIPENITLHLTGETKEKGGIIYFEVDGRGDNCLRTWVAQDAIRSLADHSTPTVESVTGNAIKSMAKDESYYESRIGKHGAYVVKNDLKGTLEPLEKYTPIHLTGKKSTYYYHHKDGKRYDNLSLLQVELCDERLVYIFEDDIEKNVQATNYYYLSNDTKVMSKPGGGDVIYKASLGESLDVVASKSSSDYSYVKIGSKSGYVKTDLLTKKEPFYVYAKRDVVDHRATFSTKRSINTSKFPHLKGERYEWYGTSEEDVSSYSKEEFANGFYLVMHKERGFIRVSRDEFTFKAPTKGYIRKSTSLYSNPSTTSSTLAKLDIGSTFTRECMAGKFVKVKTASGKVGYVKDSDISYSKIVKPKKSYGTWYLGYTTHESRRSYDYLGSWEKEGIITYDRIEHYPGEKVTRLDNKYYYVIGQIEDENVRKKYKEGVTYTVKDDYPRGSFYHGTKKGDKFVRYSDLLLSTRDATCSKARYIKVQFENGDIHYQCIDFGHVVKKKSQSDPNTDTQTSLAASKKIFNEINRIRKKYGKPELKWDQATYDAYVACRKYDEYFNLYSDHLYGMGPQGGSVGADCVYEGSIGYGTTLYGKEHVWTTKNFVDKVGNVESLFGDIGHSSMILDDVWGNKGAFCVVVNPRNCHFTGSFVYTQYSNVPFDEREEGYNERKDGTRVNFDRSMNDPYIQKFYPKRLIRNPKFDFSKKGDLEYYGY